MSCTAIPFIHTPRPFSPRFRLRIFIIRKKKRIILEGDVPSPMNPAQRAAISTEGAASVRKSVRTRGRNLRNMTLTGVNTTSPAILQRKISNMRLKNEIKCDVLVMGPGSRALWLRSQPPKRGADVCIVSGTCICSGSSFYPGTWGLGLWDPKVKRMRKT